MLKRLLLTSLITLVAVPCWARTEQSAGLAAGVAGFDTNIVHQTHDNGFFRTVTTNYGYFGTVRNRLRDTSGALVPVFESPSHSQIEYLFEAGLWVGGIVGGDTLVSSGLLGFGQAHELYADGYQPGVASDFKGDEEWSFVYGDTTTDPETVRDDPYDGPHRPLPIRVRQKTSVLDAVRAHNGLFVELVITNVGEVAIDSLWMGWLVDPDIGHADRDDYWADDITGHRKHTVQTDSGPRDISFAWAVDNDGDPDSTGQFDSASPLRGVASMYLGGTPNLSGESYNWWVPSIQKVWDWGPQRLPGDTNRFGGRGYEVMDRFRYRVMSNREIDYEQPYAAVDRSGEGWVPPTHDTIARNFADGFDIRYLHSVGATRLEPGDSIVVNWVMAITTLSHTSPSFFDLAFNADDPRIYISGLGLNGMANLMADLQFYWDSSFSDKPIRAPEDFRITGWNDTSGVIAWKPRQTLRLDGYLLRRFTRDGPPDGIEVVIPPTDSTYVDYGLDRSRTYYYTISSITKGSVFGTKSIEDSLLPDRPLTPDRPLAVGLRKTISVNWEPDGDSGVRAYRLYRRGEGEDWTLLAELTDTTGYLDSLVETATPYEYRITAISQLDNESYPSPVAEAAAFSFDGGPQILDFTTRGPASLTDKDSVAAVWTRLFAGAAYDDASMHSLPYAFIEFDPHPATVVVADGRGSLTASNDGLLRLYSQAHGATIITGRDLSNTDLVSDSLVTLAENSIGYAAGIRRAYYPRTLLANPTRMNAEFAAAAPVDPALPWLDVDASRTGWGLNPALPHPGSAIPFVGYFEIDTSVAEVLYAFVSKDGAASPLHGKPAAVMSKEPGRTLAVFAFPLSYMHESDAKACLAAVLARMGYGATTAAGDADNDGVVTAADVVTLINYLYRDGFLVNERNADVNGDCVVDVLDVVTLIDVTLRGRMLTATTCN